MRDWSSQVLWAEKQISNNKLIKKNYVEYIFIISDTREKKTNLKKNLISINYHPGLLRCVYVLLFFLLQGNNYAHDFDVALTLFFKNPQWKVK